MISRVLLAVDPTDDLDSLREVLVSMGYEVVVAKLVPRPRVDLDAVRLKVELLLAEEA